MNFSYIDTKKIQGDPNIKLDNNKVAEIIGNKPSIVSTGVVEDIEIKSNKNNSSINEKELLSIIEKELEIAELDSLLKEVDKVVGEDQYAEPQEILLADDDILINNGGGGGIIFTGGAFANDISINSRVSFFGSASPSRSSQITVTNSTNIDI